MLPLDWSPGHVVTTTSPRFLQNSTGFQCTRELCSRLWCWCGSVLTALLPATSPNSAFLLPLLQVVSSRVSLDGPTTSFQGPNHDRPAELRCRGTISVEQSSCCSTETRDDSAYLQETTESLSVLDLMCWRTEGTFTTARRCCDVCLILAPDRKLQTYLLTYGYINSVA